MHPKVTIKFIKFILCIKLSFLLASPSYGACSGTDYTWAGVTNSWNSASNWSPASIPNSSGDDVTIVGASTNLRFDTNVTIGCLTISSGVATNTNSRTITITGDSFTAAANTMSLSGSNFKFEMAGSSDQEIDVVDDIRDLVINNSHSIILKNTFRIMREVTYDAGLGSSSLEIEGDVRLNRTAAAFTIPAGHTVVIKSTGSLFARGGIVVNGTLRIDGGGELMLYRDKTLTVGSGGVLELNGSSGNAARIIPEASNRTFTFDMAGTLIANYFLVKGTTSAGMNISGTVSSMDNGEFRYVANSGHHLTLQSGASVIPSTFTSLGFYNDGEVGTPANIDASGYNTKTLTFSNYAGDVANTAYETDPNDVIDWSAPAATELALTNDAENGEPGAFYDPGDEFTFAEFAFTLTQADTETDITSVAITMTGTGSVSDFEFIRVYADTNNNCNHNSGSDTLIGDLSFSGSPPKATVSFSAGQVSTSGPSDPGCFSIRAKAAASATDQKSLKFAILSDGDVVNSESYNFSETSGPPAEGAKTIIRNPNYSTWEGSTSSSWNEASNWAGGLPTSTKACYVGSGSNIPLIDINPITCATTTLQTGGTINWNNTSNIFEVTGNLEVQSFTFTNAASSVFSMKGASNQALSFSTVPNDLVINNSGVASDNIVTLGGNVEVSGDLICSEGILTIPDSRSLTVNGDLTIEDGCKLDIEGGGTLILGDNSTLTVDSGGEFEIVGTASKQVLIKSDGPSSRYTVIINGSIAARYYAFAFLSSSGLTIGSGASIDVSNYLQDGSFYEPVNSNTTFLILNRQIPGNALSNMYFDKSGEIGLVNLGNIDTTSAAAGTLTITGYSGDLGGPTFDTDPSYNISWVGATTTLDIIVESGPASATLTTGGTYRIGEISFKIKDSGASFNDTDITSLTLELDGSATASDIQVVSLYSDSDCNGAGGTLLDSGTFSGSPPKKAFSIAGGALTVAADAVTTVKNCVYVEYKIDSNGTDNNTAGFVVSSAGDIVNSEGYSISSTTPAPFYSGTSTIDAPATTIWLGTTDSSWNESSNWSAGVPSSSKSCTINSSSHNPVISSGVEACENLTLNSGTLTINSGADLEVYGNIDISGSLVATGDLILADGGSALSHTLSSTSTLSKLEIAKTGSGNVTLGSSSLTINALTFSGSNFILDVTNTKTLILPNGVNISSGTLDVSGGGELQIGNGSSITVSGGKFSTSGSNDTFPQNPTNKGKVTVVGAGANTWSFSSTSGTVHLYGFHLDRLDNNGINIGGSTAVTNLSGGQLTNLSSSYASMKAIQLNTSGSMPTTANNVAWVWGEFNSFDPANTNTPDSSESYTLVYSSGCGSQTIDFEGWSGDFFESEDTFNPSPKVSSSGCTINLSGAASSVQLLSFDAIAYDAEVDLRWETNLEKTHLGFNVFRSNLNGDNFVQINSSLLRNLNNYSAKKGKYRFIDKDVENNHEYLYYVEDIDLSGKISLHGPVSGAPMNGLGSAPVLSDHNSGGNLDDSQDGGGSSGGSINNPSYRDLGNGVVIRHQTSSNLLLEISPAAPIFSASSWDNSYEEVVIAGYSATTEPNFPALPSRVILIELDESVSATNLIDSEVTESTLNSHLIAPAATYALDGNGDLAMSYSINPSHYISDGLSPNSYFTIQNEVVVQGSRKFLKVILNPLKHNPVQQSIQYASMIKLSIGLDTLGWDISPDTSLALEGHPNLLRIDFKKSGMYEVTFEDFENSYLDYPFAEEELSEFRLYLNGSEVAIETSSSDEFFNSGDKIRFYLEFEKSLESTTNTAFLSPSDLLESEQVALRVGAIEGDPYDMPEVERSSYLQTQSFEENYEIVDGDTLGDNGEHFVWASMFNSAGYNSVDFDVTLDQLDLGQRGEQEVQIDVHVIGMLGFFGNDNPHDLELYLDGNFVDNVVFDKNGRQVITFEIEPDYFASTTNVEIRVPGTYAFSGDYDRIILDRVDVKYFAANPREDYLNLITKDSELAHFLDGFSSSNILLYDVSDSKKAQKISNALITTDDFGVTYDINFYADEYLNSDGNKNIYALTSESFLAPSGISLNPGSSVNLKDPSNRSNYLIIGDKTLLDSTYALKLHRENEGLEVMQVGLNAIYDQFAYGSKSSSGIRDFILFALEHWELKPKYIFLIGDATNDPLDLDIWELDTHERSSVEKATIPMPFIQGSVTDFGGDNFFVSKANDHIPEVAIGRLPSNNAAYIESYIEKVIAFERGEKLPAAFKKLTFISDNEQGYYEEFKHKSQQLAELATQFQSRGFESELIDYDDFTSKAEFMTAINSAFDAPPLILNYMGHGAAGQWGSSTFLEAHARALSNETLPIVISWNCENTYFHDFDKSIVSMAESFIFNPDGGAIVFLGSSAQTTPSAQMTLAKSFYQRFAEHTNSWNKDQRIGDIFFQSKLTIGTGRYEKDIINSFNLIGDPAIKLPKEIFADKPTRISSGATAEVSGGGCSANASDGLRLPWYETYLEFFLYVFFIIGYFRLRRKVFL